MALTIDLGAPARRLTDDEFQAWAQGQTVFLSSVMGELAAERAAVAAALEQLGFRVRWFEDFGGRDDSAAEAYLGEVRSCTIYLGLLGEQYGSMLPSGPYAGDSATNAEYLQAQAAGKRISFWQRKPAEEREGHARRFLAEVQRFHVTGSFAGTADLPAKIEKRLREIAAEDLSPWVKLGDVIVRATRVRARGPEVQVEARVYDEGVLRAIDELAGGGQRWAHRRVQVTHGNRSGTGQIDELIVENTSGAFSVITVKAAADWSGGGETPVGTQGYSAEDLTEVAMRVGLLGQTLPSDLGMMSFIVKSRDPLAELLALPVPEGSVQALSRLLVVEQLVGDRRASAVTGFSLGPARRGQRHLELTWSGPERYTNIEPQERAINGIRRGSSERS
jgi:hypothetical protein